MSNLDYKGFTRRHPPHVQPPDAILFVTYRLAGSIPKAVIRAYKAKKDYVLNNPVKAGLVKHWRDWRWNYCRSELAEKVLMSDKL